MKYQLRNFENNLQTVSSIGWVFIILSLIMLVAKQQPGYLIVTIFGTILVLLQLRGKRIAVDTEEKTITSSGNTHIIKSPNQIFINRVKVSQNVNSRAQSANVKTYFYKGFLQDGDEKVLLSSNRSEDRDMAKLKAIADEFRIELVKNY